MSSSILSRSAGVLEGADPGSGKVLHGQGRMPNRQPLADQLQHPRNFIDTVAVKKEGWHGGEEEKSPAPTLC